MSTSGGSSGGAVQAATTIVNAAAIGTLFSAPTTLIAAPGVGFAVAVVETVAEFKAGASSWFPNSLAAYYGAPVLAQQAGVGLDAALDSNNNSEFVAAGPMVDVSTFGPGGAALAMGYGRAVVENAALVLGCITGDPGRGAPIVTATINAGGTGYAVNDTGTIDGADFNPAASYTVTAVTPVTGVVTAFTVTNNGGAYNTTTNPHTTTPGGGQPGVGTGFKANVTAISPADGTLYVTTLYRAITLH